MSLSDPIIAIVGRPNVGKSTLFNRLVGERRAIVEDIAGVTRDRQYGYVDSFEIPFFIVDTGGLLSRPEDELDRLTVEQTKIAIEEADAIIAMFDGKAGTASEDEEVVALLRRKQKPVYFAVNKCDGAEQSLQMADFYGLGVAELRDISALHGNGVRALVNEVLQTLPNYEQLVTQAAELQAMEAAAEAAAEQEAENEASRIEEAKRIVIPSEPEPELEEIEEVEPEFAPVFMPDEQGETNGDAMHAYVAETRIAPRQGPREYVSKGGVPEIEDADLEGDSETESTVSVKAPEVIRVAVVGRPNVGKSTLLNAILGEKRFVTSPVAGTTRDAIDAEVIRDGQRYVFVDTAGVRKKANIVDKLERYSTLRALRAIAACDVAVVVIDATEGPTDQDAKIAGLAHERGRGLLFLVNKWDLVEKDHKTVHSFTERMREVFKFAPYAPIVFGSAIKGRRASRIVEQSREIAIERLKRVSTNRLNQLLRRALRGKSAPSYHGEPAKLYYGAQTAVAPPTFVLFFNQIRNLHFSYLRYLKNTIRKEYEFLGTDIKLIPRKHRS